MSDSRDTLRVLAASFASNGQGHVFDGVDLAALSAAEADAMAAELGALDLPYLAAKFQEVSTAPPVTKITPFAHGIDLAAASPERRAELRRKGLSMIAGGQVAVILLAGGQGSRLGFDQPKGMLRPGLPSGKCIFDIHAERLLRLNELACAATASTDPASASSAATPIIPWVIMTSPATHDDTVAFFARPSGSSDGPSVSYPAESLNFIQQGTLPALDFAGKVLLSAPGTPVLAPNGNGGLYKALQISGALEHLAARGVRWVHVVGVDNILAKPADPAMLGYAEEAGTDVVNKVVPKKAASERVGVMALRNGRVNIVEYTELGTQLSEATDAAAGTLQFGAANIASHLYSLSFLRSAVARADELPWHVARKKIPFYTPSGSASADGAGASAGTVTVPSAENGIKMEMFVFDVFPWADPAKVASFSVARDDEFAPIKNAFAAPDARALAAKHPGEVRLSSAAGTAFVRAGVDDVTADSPASAVLLMGAAHARALAAAGATVAAAEPLAGAATDLSGVRVVVEPAAEVSPLLSYDADDVGNLKGYAGQSFAVPAIINAAL
jgi:UDP-N-acetylglucosamine/UDP-N-acetylgalactosamine diphosphorylase